MVKMDWKGMLLTAALLGALPAGVQGAKRLVEVDDDLPPAATPMATAEATPAPTVEAGEAAEESVDDADVAATERRLARMKRKLREQREQGRSAQRRRAGAPNGVALSMGVSLLSTLSFNDSPPGGIFPTLGLEVALGERYSLKGGYGWNGAETRDRSSTMWTGGLQLRSYPFEMGLLNGFFLGPGVDYLETRYADVRYVGLFYEKVYDYSYGHSWGVGPVLGYQWVLGRTVLISMENSYRYHWVEVPKGHYSSDYYYYTANNGGGGNLTNSSWEFKGSMGWVF